MAETCLCSCCLCHLSCDLHHTREACSVDLSRVTHPAWHAVYIMFSLKCTYAPQHIRTSHVQQLMHIHGHSTGQSIFRCQEHLVNADDKVTWSSNELKMMLRCALAGPSGTTLVLALTAGLEAGLFARSPEETPHGIMRLDTALRCFLVHAGHRHVLCCLSLLSVCKWHM